MSEQAFRYISLCKQSVQNAHVLVGVPELPAKQPHTKNNPTQNIKFYDVGFYLGLIIWILSNKYKN